MAKGFVSEIGKYILEYSRFVMYPITPRVMKHGTLDSFLLVLAPVARQSSCVSYKNISSSVRRKDFFNTCIVSTQNVHTGTLHGYSFI